MGDTQPAKAVVAWSSGKDSAWAFHLARRSSELEIVGTLTTLTDPYERVSMHGVREALLDQQTARLGVPNTKVRIPSPCPNETYEAQMAVAMETLGAQGVTHVVFGDLFLADIRAYREAQLARAGMTPVFPLWGLDTTELAHTMLAAGLRAHLTCVDPRAVDRAIAGREYNAELLRDLPEAVDPCGENGEFHTFVTAGPMFDSPIPVATGEVVERGGFVFADIMFSP